MAFDAGSLTLTAVEGTDTVADSLTGSTTTPGLRIGRTRGAPTIAVQVVQVGTATTPARVEVQASFDGVNYSKVKARPAGTAAGTYQWIVTLPASASWVRIVNTPQVGGSSSTTDASLGLSPRVAPPKARVHLWFWDENTPAALLANPAVIPMCRIVIGSSGKGAAEYAADAADEIAAIVAAKIAAGDHDASGYSIFLQNFGNTNYAGTLNSDSPDLFTHADDRVEAADTSMVKGVFTANGRAEAYAWMQTFAQTLRPLLEAANLPLPEALHLDVEGGTLSVPDALPSDEDGWYQACLNDARAGTEDIDGTSTLDELVTAWTTVNGGAVAFTDANNEYYSQGSVGRTNGNRFIQSLVKAVQSWALYDSYVRPMVETFPTILRHSNYDNWTCSTKALAVPDRSKAWLLQYGAKQSMTHAGQVLYPIPNEGWQGTDSAKADWATALGYTLTGDDVADFSAMYVLHATTVVEALVASNQPQVPWLTYPGEPYPVGSFASGMTYTVLEADLTAIAVMCADEGLREIVSWQGSTGLNWSSVRRVVEAFVNRVNILEGAA